MAQMSNDQSKGPLLDYGDWDSHQPPTSGRSIKEKSPPLDNAIRGVKVPQVINLSSIDLDRYRRDGRIDGFTTLVLLCWGAGLLAFLAYALTMKGEIFQNNSWETYQVAAQITTQLSIFLGMVITIREAHEAERLSHLSKWRTLSATSHQSVICLIKSWHWPLKAATAALVAFWIVLPGKFGLLQVLSVRERSSHSNVTIQYTYLSEVDMGARLALCCNGLFAEYARLLLSQGEYFHSPSDFYGNVKIPDIYRLKGYNEEDVEWTAIPSHNSTAYSSLMGVPVSGVPIIGNTTFTIETSYYSVTCDNVTLGPPQDFWIIHEGHAVLESPIYNGPFSETNTTFGLDSTASFSVATAGFQKPHWPQHWQNLRDDISAGFPDISELEPQPLLIQSTYYGSSIRYVREHQSKFRPNTMVSAYCTIQMHYVSVNVTCTPASCIATSMRPSQILHPNMKMTDLGSIRAFYEFTRTLMIAGRDGHAAVNGDIIDGNTLTEYFLQNPYFGSNRDRWGNSGPWYNHPVSSLPTPEAFGLRIQMVLNGFRMLHMGGTLVRDWPNLSNTRFTTGNNVVGESVVIMRFTNVIAVLLLVVELIISAVVEGVAYWRTRKRSVQLE